MPFNYGVSMSICFSKGKELMEVGDFRRVYLNMLDYLIEFTQNQDLKFIEIVSIPPFGSSILNQIKDEVREKINGFKTSYHLPIKEINICALDPYIRKASVDEMKRLINFAEDVGVNKLVGHPGDYASLSEIYSLLGEQIREISKEVILELFEYSKERKIEFCIENLTNRQLFFQKPDEFQFFIENNVGFILDTAHSIICGIDPVDFVSKFGNKISEIHLVDGFEGEKDIHYPLGTAELDYRNFLGELEKINFKGPIILELKSREDAVKSLEALRNSGFL
jgi:sugar phosphate isomerase/epimerase